MTLTATGIYQDTEVDSRQDYFLGIQSRAGFAPALNTLAFFAANGLPTGLAPPAPAFIPGSSAYFSPIAGALIPDGPQGVLRSEEHTSELQSLMRISYSVFCLTNKNEQ